MNTNNNCNKDDSIDDLTSAMGKLKCSGTCDTDDISDDDLFKQPPPKDDCPICLIGLPTLGTGSTHYACCGKIICSGCDNSPVYDNLGNKIIEEKCPFCRTPVPTSIERIEMYKKRAEVGDSEAIFNLGCNYDDGADGFPQDDVKHLNYLFGQEILVMSKLIAILVMLTI